MVDPVEYEAMPEYLQAADILVIPRPRMLSTHFSAANKIGDYMASGKAILATDIYPHRKAIKNRVNGLLCRPAARSLKEGLLELGDPLLRERLGSNARDYAEKHYDYREASNHIIDIIEEAIRQS